MCEVIALQPLTPDCDYTIRITAQKEAEPTWVSEGQGNLTIRVFGFNERDFKSPPIVTIVYFRNGASSKKRKPPPHRL